MALSSGFAGSAGLRLLEERPGPVAGGAGVHLWLHAAEVEGHDFHAGAGSFARAVEAIAAARVAGVAVAVSTLLTRSNARVLGALPRWLHAHGVRGWRVAVPRVAGPVGRASGPGQVRGVGALDGLLPRLSVALPYALQAVAVAGQVGLKAGVGGAPWCLLGPFAGGAIDEPARGFAEVCMGCPARGGCPGVDAGYLRRFAGDELSPRGLRAPRGTGPAAEMFPGPGTLEQVLEDMSEGTAERVRLPVLRGGGGGV